MEAGLEAADACPALGEVTIPHPTENVVSVLPVDFTEAAESFRVM